ncbi:siderophore-interacting protein [Streptomyces pathocidini]|uniref:Siderophore-interacting protein n=1 Tax=Streptomyces pathocidini TaxID=1650571 RepID=A0ABW7UPP0_9ACTN|nr:siderophore-interacting protein [Streptomyces pathocidini]
MTAVTTATAAPFRFFDAHVVRGERLGPSVVRITFGGEALREFACGGRDQSFSLFLPHPGQPLPVVPTWSGDGWFAQWRAMDPAVRAVMRSYTVREARPERAELDVDFALHGDGGPASRWAARALPGDCVVLLGPTAEDNKSVGFRPPLTTDWVLLTADETALPAVAGILAWLPSGVAAKVWIEVPDAGDLQHLPTAADAEVNWLVRGTGPDRREGLLLDAVRAAELPGGSPYAWIAGESGSVRALRRHLVGERGFDRKSVKFAGYWRQGASEEDLRAEALSGSASSQD